MPAQRYDIFCNVVDNYGDVGASWRLARQLVGEHGIAVTLWIDALASLARIAPDVDAASDDQTCAGVRVRAWREALGPFELPDVVIEAFGCGLPDAYFDAMAKAPRPPLWINLEYLSAESWVDSAHGLPSRHPRLPLTKYFFFPGFTTRTGGLLREAGMLDERARVRSTPHDPPWQSSGISLPPEALVVSLFCYANRALPRLLDAWTQGNEPVGCLVPEGVASAELDTWTRGRVPRAGHSIVQRSLTLATLPFVAQDQYDRLLWDCDLNIVRGEDSFVRAQWAARPFVWHIYPQAEDAHRVKLEAFLRGFETGLDERTRRPLTDFWRAFNDDHVSGAALAWPAFRTALPKLQKHAATWSRQLARQSDLAANLVEFCEQRL